MILSIISNAFWPCVFLLWRNVYLGLLPSLLEKEMAPHSSTLAWKIPWAEEPGRLQFMGLLRVGHDWATSLSPFHFHALEKAMAPHSSTLAWSIPGTGEPGGLPSMGSHRVGHDWSDLVVVVVAQFSIELFGFLLLNCMSCLYILKIKSLLVTLFTNIFSHSVGCLFVYNFFTMQKLIHLMKPIPYLMSKKFSQGVKPVSLLKQVF